MAKNTHTHKYASLSKNRGTLRERVETLEAVAGKLIDRLEVAENFIAQTSYVTLCLADLHETEFQLLAEDEEGPQEAGDPEDEDFGEMSPVSILRILGHHDEADWVEEHMLHVPQKATVEDLLEIYRIGTKGGAA